MQDGDVRLPEASQREACEAFHAGLCPVLTGRAVSSECGCYHTCVLNGATVLVADDDRDVRRINTRVLERTGIEVLSYSDGHEAYQAIMSEDLALDVAVLDVSMPRMNGFEVCRALREKQANIPVVFATGYDGRDLGQALDQIEANALLSKPFCLEQLRHTVGGMICPFMGQHLFGAA
ncbi:MAG: response regulator [Verrucomicrobia bacterium]|nr:response regulator [Verrucomicrobiota bacterium]MBT7068131.1 response regulator [Verrucomicrobiota bacterium]MBT7700325.1 response regulator [Verrucomicrobiota bacterium]